MEFFRIRRDIPFMRHALVFNVDLVRSPSLAAVFFLVTRGLHLSIEFTGGTVMEVELRAGGRHRQDARHGRGLGLGEVQVQNFGTSRDVLIRLPLRGDVKQSERRRRASSTRCARPKAGTVVGQAVHHAARASRSAGQACAARRGAEPLKLQRTEFVGPQVGEELAADGVKALAFVVVGIMLYLAFRFEWKFSVAGIVANLHDVVIILGFFAFFQWEFSLAVLAAVLAVLGYSVNESVVIFDRIREAFRSSAR